MIYDAFFAWKFNMKAVRLVAVVTERDHGSALLRRRYLERHHGFTV